MCWSAMLNVFLSKTKDHNKMWNLYEATDCISPKHAFEQENDEYAQLFGNIYLKTIFQGNFLQNLVPQKPKF